MHERSVVTRLIEQVDEELTRRGLIDLTEVSISLGEFSGIEPVLLASAFEELAADHWKRNVRLELEIVPLTASCQNCGCTFRVERFQFNCPECHCGTVQVTRGEEMRLVSLTACRSTPAGIIA